MQEQKIIVFYHENCTDGFGAAYAAWTHFGSGPTTFYIPVNYKPIQDIDPKAALDYLFKGTDIDQSDLRSYFVYVLDYCFPLEHFQYHRQVFKDIVVIDHHKTAIENYAELISDEKMQKDKITIALYKQRDKNTGEQTLCPAYIEFTKNASGALAAYMGFQRSKLIPMGIKLISDRDLWTFEYGQMTRAFYLYLQSIKPWSFEQWHAIMESENFMQYIEIGQTLFEAREKLVSDYFEKRAPLTISYGTANQKQARGYCVSAPPEIASDLGERIYTHYSLEDAQFALIYQIKEDGKVLCSLRSRPEFSVEEIAKHYGGGGHKSAAGFTVDFETFNKFFQ